MFLTITDLNGLERLANSDFIVGIGHAGNKHRVITLSKTMEPASPMEHSTRYLIFISHEEYARVEALLTCSASDEPSDTDAYLKGRRHGYDKAFADGADWQKTQTPALPDVETVEYARAAAITEAIAKLEENAAYDLVSYAGGCDLTDRQRNNLLLFLNQFYQRVVDIDILAKSAPQVSQENTHS